MATIKKENLEERLERIRKKNEEIEKKYREAEEDRIKALQNNAMVEVKPPKDEDWPKAHKYDKIDFTYDVKPEKLEEYNNSKKLLEPTLNKSKREYKKFVDGEGPPPDPAYNFLADAERDGLPISKQESRDKNMENRKDQNKGNKNSINRNGSNSSNNSNNNSNNDSQFNKQRGNLNNKSFRGGHGNGKQQQQQKFPKFQKQKSMPEYEQWRNEREKIDEARINRQKIGEGKWKREWDNDKMNSENEALLKTERVTIGDVISNAGIMKKGTNPHGRNHINNHGGHIHHAQQQQQQQQQHHHQQQQNVGGLNSAYQNYHSLQQQQSYHQQNTDYLIEKRGNITVSVSETGEVKSVKLTSAPAIGTGRVGPRQLNKPQFSIQTVEKNTLFNQNSPKNVNKNNNTGQVIGHNQQNSQKNQQQQHHQPQQNVHSPKNANQNHVQGTNHRPQFHQNSNDVIQTPRIGTLVNVQNNNSIPNNGKKIQSKQQNPKSHPPVNAVPLNKSPIPANVINKIIPSVPVTDVAIEKDLTIQTTLPSVGILPVVDLSHKPEFARKSVQERLVRARQSQSLTTEEKIDSERFEIETKNITPSKIDSQTDSSDKSVCITEMPKCDLNVSMNEVIKEVINTEEEVSSIPEQTSKDILEISTDETISNKAIIEVESNSTVSNSFIGSTVDAKTADYENSKTVDPNYESELIIVKELSDDANKIKTKNKNSECENVKSVSGNSDEQKISDPCVDSITEECKISVKTEEITSILNANSEVIMTKEDEKSSDENKTKLNEEIKVTSENEEKIYENDYNKKESVLETETREESKENLISHETKNNSVETNN